MQGIGQAVNLRVCPFCFYRSTKTATTNKIKPETLTRTVNSGLFVRVPQSASVQLTPNIVQISKLDKQWAIRNEMK